MAGPYPGSVTAPRHGVTIGRGRAWRLMNVVALAAGVIASALPAASAADSGEIWMPKGTTVATIQARGLECRYEAPPIYTSPTLAWLPATAPAVAVPANGHVAYAVTAASSAAATGTVAPQLIRIDANTATAAVAGAPALPGTSGLARVCTVVASPDGSTAAVMLVNADGAQQWSVIGSTGASMRLAAPGDATLTTAAALSADGRRILLIAQPCGACSGSMSALAYDTATGAEVGQLVIPVDLASLVAAGSQIAVGAGTDGFVLSVRTPTALRLWNLTWDGAARVQRDVPAALGQAVPATASCQAQPGIQVRNGALLASAAIALDYSSFPLAAGHATDLPVGESVRIIDTVTLQDRVAFDAYRGPIAARTEDNTLCPYFGPMGTVVDASNVYSSITGRSLGWDSSGEFKAGRVQGNRRIWRASPGSGLVSFFNASPQAVIESDIPLNFVPTMSLASVSQVRSSPALAHLNATLTDVIEGDYDLYATYSGEEDGQVTADLQRRGTTVRFVPPYDQTDGGYVGIRVTYANPRIWCTRTTTAKLPNTLSADLKAQWTCTKGSAGWQTSQVITASAISDQLADIQDSLTDWQNADGQVVVFGSNLADAQAQRIEWMSGFNARPGTSSIECTTETNPYHCRAAHSTAYGYSGTMTETNLFRGAPGLPRLTSSGRLLRRS